MRGHRIVHHLFIACAFGTALTGCAGVAAPPNAAAARSSSWTQPEATGQDLLYISAYEGDYMSVFTWPGLAPFETIRYGGSLGLCTDASGDVFVGSGGVIYEYEHGGTKPIATLHDGHRYAWACSVDPTTGNLAVASTASPSANNGDIAIYKGARGSPKAYKNPRFLSYTGCGYDASGNLYVMGFGKNSGHPNLFAELPKGGSSLKLVTLGHTPQGQGDVQWDGKYVAVLSPNESEIFRFQIKGNIGRLVGLTALDSSQGMQQFSFPEIFGSHKQATQVIGASSSFGNFMVWNYPAGGYPTKTLNTGPALDAVVSTARRQPNISPGQTRHH
jgi:hypothetical protein